MNTSKNPENPIEVGTDRARSCDPDGVEPLLRMIDYLLPEVGRIEPIAGYFLRMCRASLIEVEQRRADALGRH